MFVEVPCLFSNRVMDPSQFIRKSIQGLSLAAHLKYSNAYSGHGGLLDRPLFRFDKVMKAADLEMLSKKSW